MQFTIRELIWLTLLVALIVLRFIDRAEYLDRELAVRSLAHRIDLDVHDHLEVVTNRMRDIEQRADLAEKWHDEDGRRDAAVDQTLSQLITDVGALQGKWPSRPK